LAKIAEISNRIMGFQEKKRIIFHRKLAKLAEISDNNIFFQEKTHYFSPKISKTRRNK
jgi:hypothetical protein